MNITYSQFMFLALVIEHAKRMNRIASCVQSGSTLFSHIISLKQGFSKKKVIEQNVCFDFLYKFCPKRF